MYKFVDRPLAQLDAGARFLVWSMRLWVGAIGLGQCPAPAIAPAFARWKVIGGLPHFHRAMALFNRDALETFHFCSLACDHVSEHEALVLSLICTLQEDRPATARDTLALLVGEDAVADLIGSLSQLSVALTAAAILPRPAQSASTPSTGATSTEKRID